MTRLRLSPAVSVVPLGTTVVIRSDLGMFKLEGGDLSLFLERLIPLLREGSADAAAIAGALPEFDAQSVAAVLDLLVRYGVVEPEVDDPQQRRWYGQTTFFQKWTGNGAGANDALRRARVLIVALEPVGMLAALELAASGVGTLHLLDDDIVSERDLPFVRGLRPEDVGRPRREALQRLIEAEAPWCSCTAAKLEIDEERVLVCPGDFDFVLTTAAEDDLLVFRAAAAFAHQRKMRSISACLRDVEAVIGPLVFPGSACWNCTRLRMLANSETPGTEHSLHALLLRQRSMPRARTYLAPMPSIAAGIVATELVAALTGYSATRLGGRMLVMNLRTFETSFHAVVRMPWCPICGGASQQDEPGAPLPPGSLETPEDVRAATGGWVDDRVGVVRYVSVGGGDVQDPELPITASALLSSYAEATYHEHEPQLGSGKGLTAAEAMIGAIGEATERYSAARYDRHKMRRASVQELGAAAIDPRDLVLYSEAQYASADFPFSRFDAAQPIDWCDGWWLDDRTPVSAPALPSYFDFIAPPAERFCQVSSNGLAAGASLDDAALRATWELVERDAFMLTWLARLPVRRIVWGEELDVMLGEVLRQLRESGADDVELYLLNAGIDIPAVLCAAYGDGRRWPAVTAALAAHPDGPTAVRKAILEQGHVGPYVRRLMNGGERVPETPDDVKTLTDHAMYYAPPSRRGAFDFLRNSATVRLRDLPREPHPDAAGTSAALNRAGVRVGIVDVTSPDTRLGPFRVARALGLNMQPIHFGHALVRPENPRLRAFTAELNPDPHPLA